MSPEEHLHKAAATLDSVHDRHQIDELLEDLEQVFAALQPDKQEAAAELIGRLQEKRREL